MNSESVETILLFCAGFIFGCSIVLGYWGLAVFISICLAYIYKDQIKEMF